MDTSRLQNACITDTYTIYNSEDMTSLHVYSG